MKKICLTAIFGGYKIGTELLIINAALAFILLFLCSKKAPGPNAPAAMAGNDSA